MNTITKTLSGVGLTLAMLGAAPADAARFTLDPAGGDIHGHPGDTVGWGFKLYNDTANFLVVTSAGLQSVSAFGTFTDFLGPRFLELAPWETRVEAFDLINQLGVGSFTIDPSAPGSGSVVSGRILLSFDLYAISTSEPRFDPDTDSVSTGNTVLAATSVPEPITLLLLGVGVLGLPRPWRRMR